MNKFGLKAGWLGRGCVGETGGAQKREGSYHLLLPPVEFHVLGRVGHAPEKGLAVGDEVAEAAGGEEDEGEDAEDVED